MHATSDLASSPTLARNAGGRLREPLAIVWFSLLFALEIGVRNGEINQVFYLLDGMHRADPAFLATDWYTKHAVNYHFLWSLLVADLQRLGVLPIGLAVGTLLMVLAFAISLYAIMRALYPRPLLPWALALLLFGGLFTRGIGDFVLLPTSVEPMGLAAVALVVGLALVAHGRFLGTGLSWGVAALIHVHFALLTAGFLVPFSLLRLGRPQRAGLLRIWIPFALLAAPSAVTLARAATFPDGRTVFLFLSQLGPQHYYPWRGDPMSFLLFGAALVLGLGGALLRPPRPDPWLDCALAAIAALVLAGLLLGQFDIFWMVNRALPWRLSFLLILAGTAAGAAALADAESLPGGTRPRDPRAIAGWCLVVLGLALFFVVGSPRLRLAAAAAGAVPATLFLLRRAHLRQGAIVLPAIIVTAGAAPVAWVQARESHVAFAQESGAQADIYAWARARAPSDSVFVAPPGWRDFRLNAGRALVADWWASPMVGADVIEWRRRLSDLSGGRDVRSFAQMEAAYEAMDCAGARLLVRKYQVRYVIRPRTRPLPCGTVVHRDALYEVTAFLPERAAGRP